MAGTQPQELAVAPTGGVKLEQLGSSTAMCDYLGCPGLHPPYSWSKASSCSHSKRITNYFPSQGPALAAKLGFDPYWALPWAWCPTVCRDTEQCILLASWPCPFTQLHVLHSYIWTSLMAEWERVTVGRRRGRCLGSMRDIHRTSSRRFREFSRQGEKGSLIP